MVDLEIGLSPFLVHSIDVGMRLGEKIRGSLYFGYRDVIAPKCATAALETRISVASDVSIGQACPDVFVSSRDF